MSGAQPAMVTYCKRSRGNVDRHVLLRYDMLGGHQLICDKETYQDLQTGMTLFICGFPVTVIDKPHCRLQNVSDRYRVYISHFPSFSECFG